MTSSSSRLAVFTGPLATRVGYDKLGNMRRSWRRVLRHDPCAYCGDNTAAMTVDHIEPLSKGGINRRENIVGSCRSCNASKDSKSLLLFLLER